MHVYILLWLCYFAIVIAIAKVMVVLCDCGRYYYCYYFYASGGFNFVIDRNAASLRNAHWIGPLVILNVVVDTL